MKKVLFVLKILLKSSLIFLISFIWLNYFLNSAWLAGAISFAITLIIELITIYSRKKNKNKTFLKIKEKEDAENMFLSLASKTDYLSFFYNLASTRHSNCAISKHFISLQHLESKVILYPFMKIAKISPDDIMQIYNNLAKKEVEKIVIPCNEYDSSCTGFIKNLPIKIVLLDKYQTYSLLYSEYDFYPEITISYKKEIKQSLKDLIAFAFNKSRTKGYILSAFVLFFPSFFIKFNLYYTIIGSILLLFAIISFINPKYNIKKEQTIL